MSEHVAIIGPSTPAEFAERFGVKDAARLTLLPGLGGQPVNALVRALLAAGTRVDLVTLDPTVTKSLVFTGDGLRVLVGGYRPRARDRAGDIFRAERRQLASLTRESTAPVLHAQWTYEFAWAALGTGRPCVVTAHDAPLTVLRLMPDPYRAVRAVMAARVARRATYMTAVSPTIAHRWVNQMRFRGPIEVVPNAVAPIADDRALVGDREPLVLCVANDSRLKNVRGLLRAFVQVRCRQPQVRLELVGPGLGPESPIERWARTSGLATGVDFRGPLLHAQVRQRMATAALLAHPSLEESFGMAVAEAMSAGLPVVAGSSSGAVPWLLNTGVAGRLTDVRDPTKLAESVECVLTQPAYAATLAAAGRLRAADFAPERVAQSYLAVYRGVLHGRQSLSGAVGGAS